MPIKGFNNLFFNNEALKDFKVANFEKNDQIKETSEMLDMPLEDNIVDMNGKGRKDNHKYNEGGLNIPMIYQDDYEDVKLGTTTVKDGGCGYTSIAMVLSYLTGKDISPVDIVEWGERYYIEDVGMDYMLFLEIPEHYDVDIKIAYSVEDATEALKQGKPVICAQGEGLFTGSGHFIVLRGMDENGNILVNDPNIENAVGKDYNVRAFTPEEIAQSAAQYWIFE